MTLLMKTHFLIEFQVFWKSADLSIILLQILLDDVIVKLSKCWQIWERLPSEFEN